MRSLFGKDFEVQCLGQVDALDEALRARGATRSSGEMSGKCRCPSISAEVSWRKSICCRKRAEKTGENELSSGSPNAASCCPAGLASLGVVRDSMTCLNLSGCCSKEMPKHFETCFQSLIYPFQSFSILFNHVHLFFMCGGKPFKLSFSIQSAALESALSLKEG